MKKIIGLTLGIFFIISSIFLISGCGCSVNHEIIIPEDNILLQYFDSNLPSGTVEFTHSVLNFEDINRIIPLGNLNPPGHAYPTDHMYFLVNSFEPTVYAPAGGKILFIEEPGDYGDRAIRIAVTNSITYYLGHIFINEGLQVGDVIEAGSQIGTNGNTSCVDLGLLNKNIDNGFISEKMPLTTKYGDKPLLHYCEPLRSQLYALVKPATPDSVQYPDYIYDEEVTDGEFAFDISGTLSGNWIEEGNINSDGSYDWDATLSFSYDNFFPDQIRIASGKYYHTFALKNEDNPIKPENASTQSGVITYYLYNANNAPIGLPTGNFDFIMLVQMLSENRIKLEIFNSTNENPQFTSATLYYSR